MTDEEILQWTERNLASAGRVHVLTWEQPAAEKIAAFLSTLAGAGKVALVERDTRSIPETPIVAADVSQMCFQYLRAGLRGEGERTDEMLRSTCALILNVPAQARLSPCVIADCLRKTPSDPGYILASMQLPEFFTKYESFTDVTDPAGP